MSRRVNRYEPPPPIHGPFHSGDPAPPPYAVPGQAPSFYPLTVGRAVSVSFSLYRFAWRVLVPISVVTTIPSAVAVGIVGLLTIQQITDWEQSVLRQASAGNSGFVVPPAIPIGALALSVVVSGLLGVFILIGFAAMIDAIRNAMSGQRMSVIGSLKAAGARWRSLIGVYVLILTVIGLLPLAGAVVPSLGALGPAGLDLPGPLIFGGLVVGVAVLFALVFVGIRIALTVQALMIEGISGRDALRRSWALVAGSMWRLMGWALVFGLIVGLLSLPFNLLLSFISLIVAPPRLTFPPTFTVQPAAYLVQSVLLVLVQAVILPLADIGFVLLYFDLRFRHGEKVPVPGQRASG
ncbi:MAG TPA: hypothetical protein VH371_02780 [Candidatus Limnocylindrales bacterium]